jgi:hypothetical protein
MAVMVEYWRCVRGGNGLVLYVYVTGHERGHPYKVEANVHLKRTLLDVVLLAKSRLSESPALVEVDIPTEGFAPGQYDIEVWFDGESIGKFPCEVGELERALGLLQSNESEPPAGRLSCYIGQRSTQRSIS